MKKHRKILWVSNSPIGPASEILGKEYKGSSGGWIQSEYEQLEKETYDFFFLTTSPDVKKGEIIHKRNKNGEVFCIHAPRLSYGIQIPKEPQRIIDDIINQIKPDIIQIWGTETWLSNAVAKANTGAPKIIFIQGLLGIHKRYLGGYFGREDKDRQYRKRTSPVAQIKAVVRKRNFKLQADIEKETIALCKNVIIDSDFARAYCSSISSDIHCFQHALLPNQKFYEKKWKLKTCDPHSIFTVYGSSTEKGTQNLLKALHIVKRVYPDVKVYIPGIYQLDKTGNLIESKTDSFQTILYHMISDLNLRDNVRFTGRLDVEQMTEFMKNCHIFVNPSCMEVHALSLREALVEGVPCISTQCGSVLEYVQHNENGLIYRYEEYETLAYYIQKIFDNDDLALKLSLNATTALNEMQFFSMSLGQIYEKLYVE